MKLSVNTFSRANFYSLSLVATILFSNLNTVNAQDNKSPKSIETSPDSVAAIVNGHEIHLSTIDRLIKQKPEMAAYLSLDKDSPELAKVRSQLLGNVIDRELLLAAAKKAGTVDEAEIKKASDSVIARYGGEEKLSAMLQASGSDIKQFKSDLHDDLLIGNFLEKNVIKDVKVDDTEIHKVFDANPQHYAEGETVHARHILIKSAKNEPPEKDAAAKAKIDQIYKEVTKPDADFASIAKAQSECPSAPKGGDLGTFSKGMMVPEFEKTAFALTPGQISTPIRTEFGYHIIKVEEKKMGSQPDFAKARPVIEREILTKKKIQVVDTYLKDLKKDAKIEIKLPKAV